MLDATQPLSRLSLRVVWPAPQIATSARMETSRERGHCVYGVRMARVNITVPDDVVARARVAGLNVSRLATAALLDELDRLAKIEALDAYLAELEAELGPPSAQELEDASTWAERLDAPPDRPRRRRSA